MGYERALLKFTYASQARSLALTYNHSTLSVMIYRVKPAYHPSFFRARLALSHSSVPTIPYYHRDLQKIHVRVFGNRAHRTV